jgi:hypothetical protein
MVSPLNKLTHTLQDQELPELANHSLQSSKSLHTLMFLKNSSIHHALIYKLPLPNNQYQSELMPKNGNSINQEYSLTVENNSTMVSWLLVMMHPETGK